MKESVLDVGDDYFQNIATPLDQSFSSVGGEGQDGQNKRNEASVNHCFFLKRNSKLHLEFQTFFGWFGWKEKET